MTTRSLPTDQLQAIIDDYADLLRTSGAHRWGQITVDAAREQLAAVRIYTSANPIDLNAASPDVVPDRLTAAVEAFHESASELASAWQDPKAGAIWSDFARILQRAATQCEAALTKRGLVIPRRNTQAKREG